MINTDICNMALSFLAKPSIADLAETSEEARQCKIHYDHNRKQLLRTYTWGFAKRFEALSELTHKHPVFERVYAYPLDCLAVRRIYNDEQAISDLDRKEYDVFVTEDRTVAIACSLPQARMEYTADIIDSYMFSPDFVEVLARMLAFNLALPLTGNASIQQMQFQLAQGALARAQYETAAERHRTPEYPDKYIRARS